MIRFGGLLGIVEIGLLVYCLIDAVQADRTQVRSLPKLAWVVLIVLLPLAGSVAWLLVGRPSRSGRGPGGAGGRPVGPDDDPDFLRGIG